MKSISQIWRQFNATISTKAEPDNNTAISPTAKNANDIEASALKSVIRNRAKSSPKIDVVTHHASSVNSVNSSSSSTTKPNENLNGRSSSLLDISLNFIESTDSLNQIQQDVIDNQKLHSKSVDPSPTDLLPKYVDNNLSSSILTCGSEFHNKWPIFDSIEQVHRLCEEEQTNGTSQSRLALCLHLMESAWQVDPNNDMMLPPEEIKRHSGVFEEVISALKLNSGSKTPSTLGEAMVMESKKMLKKLACSSQNMGQRAEAEAQFLLGNCYGMGALGWPIDHKQAFRWYFQASKYGHPEATYRTAVCYELGLGTARDGTRASTFYRKAAHLMHVPSMYKLGVILLRGYYGQQVSKREGVIWLQRAACIANAPLAPGEELKATTVAGNGGIALPHALHALAIVHLTKECQDTSMIPDPSYAIKLLHNAARLDYAPSQSKLGECYECGYFCPEDEAQSIYWYTLAAQQDYPEACLALSGWYLTGSLKTNTLMQSDQEAYLWARKAAKLSRYQHSKSLTAKAYFTIGVYYEHGIGTSRSVEMANRWYKKAAQYNHPEAIKMML
ncbi:uncharacterized protein B0P05DRAFT_529797 [Gilbertella persicaria]|uniref:uncharacterized protein n=1 Tax=Gilbertella persicaria TaxID=101096 RepID=UPI00221F0924|nr:uncharacterized protein B0P05DRAFT_529797 [Gilbertella persicaria]KAI8090207.1 hypothetical protein B0P05DRAFT_529797 [Gilbertella persicaria]